jgi:hypothetical protein
MINTTIKYIVYTHTGSGVRHHHFGTQNNIINEADGHAVAGDVINALGFASLPFNGNNLPFVFMSVHGAADGNHLYTESGNQVVSVGSSNIDILVVYAPIGGIGSGGGPGIWVDAFNVDIGSFSDSDFIQVLKPPTPPDTLDNPKTSHANMEGDVSSLAAENLRAFTNIDGGIPFLKWEKIIPVQTILTTREVKISQNETGEIWFAFYQTHPLPAGIVKFHDEMLSEVGKWLGVEYYGPYGPHPVPFPYPEGQFQLSIDPGTIKSLSLAQQNKLRAYMKEYPAVAKAAYDGMVKVSDFLKGVSDLLSGIKGK